MKRINIILLCVVIALVFGFLGFLIGININDKLNITNLEKDLVGTYKTNEWNGKEAVLVLQKDKTMIHPNGYRGTWYIENEKLFVEYEIDIPTFEGNSQSTETTKNKQELTIVSNGLLLNTHFFEKIKQ